MSPLTVLTVPSRESIEIDSADLIIDGRLSLNPAVEEKGYFSVHYHAKKLTLTAGPHCGLIPINERIAIDVQPKMPIGNLNRVFDVAMGQLVRLEGLGRSYDASSDQRAAVMDFMAHEFLRYLRLVVAAGLHKSYVQKVETSSNPRGRILLKETLRQWRRGLTGKLTTSYFEHSLDIPENRLIKAAALVLMSKFDSRRDDHRKLRRELGGMLRYFSSVSGPRASDYVRASHGNIHAHLPSERSAVIRLSEMLLQGRQVQIDRQSGSVLDLSAVVVNFDHLFEDYVRNSLVLHAATMTTGDIVEKGKKPLFDDRKKPEAEPDIVIKNQHGHVVGLVEVKYKSWPNRSDQNQAVTYAASYRLNEVILLHQADNQHDAGLAHIGTVGPYKLTRYGLRLDSADLVEEEKLLAKSIFRQPVACQASTSTAAASN
ncbi:hypothetical protein GRI33_07720 [Brucella sp. BO3]|uniref:5-methylcytosine restriction system specificity protein McrC n=1 Tax=unclassified Brucella TaxID=2632610 RepID=UPI00084FA019|nr:MULTISPECIES: hypothetical protein [unclassified Brucella]OEI82880.1 hypothetical protein BA060_11200 [Brucella sp. B13-0095]QMV26814.1 hypothetical protein GRI33_07720 [Brucella sp. BO3]